MPVYFIQCEVTNLIKIGCVLTPEALPRRIQVLVAQSPTPLAMLGIILDVHFDGLLHDRFNHLWDHGEWFKPAQDLLDYIKEAAVEFTPISNKRCVSQTKRGENCLYPATHGDYCGRHAMLMAKKQRL